MKVKGFVRSRMRESRTYGSVRGGYRKVSVYSIGKERLHMKYDVTIGKELFSVYPEIRLGLLRFHADEKAPDERFWDYMNDGVEEDLRPGVMHICPKGSEHSIVNTGEEDLVMLTIVVKK